MIRVLALEPFVAATIDTLTLWDLPLNLPAELIGFTDTLSDRYRGRLQEFGFHSGEEISCQQQPGFGAPRVFRVSNATYCLDQELAQQVLVRPVGACPDA
jgi:Fe2+ transport system protein FeoA